MIRRYLRWARTRDYDDVHRFIYGGLIFIIASLTGAAGFLLGWAVRGWVQ